jgi:hypothetical protein
MTGNDEGHENGQSEQQGQQGVPCFFTFYPTISLITHQEHDPTRTTPLLPPHCHNYPHPIQPDPILNALLCADGDEKPVWPWFVFDVCFPFCKHMFFVAYMVTSPS